MNPQLTEPVQLGEFTFEPQTGELTRTGADGVTASQRLAPQPAMLLSLLVEKGGEIATREEIRQRLWPDVQIDFDQGLHFCIRQLRTALEDSATDPQYIRTIPRRGYCLVAKLNQEVAIDLPGHSTQSTSLGTNRRSVLIVTAAAFVVTLLALFARLGPWNTQTPRSNAAEGTTMRLAIMPFRPPTDMDHGEDLSAVAERLLVNLTNHPELSAAVIGPTTTAAFSGRSQSLRAMAQELNLDYIVNGRFITRDGNVSLLAELIQASDGAHIWVNEFKDLQSWQLIASEIERNVLLKLQNLSQQPEDKPPPKDPR